MSNASALQALEYEAETAWGEDVTTFATHRIPYVGALDLNGAMKQAKLDSQRVVQRLQENTEHILGPMEGSFKIKLWLSGHGTTMVGSPTVDAIETFLAYAFGIPSVTGVLSAAASTTFSGGTATAPTTTASGTFAAGSFYRAGVKGDARCDGQAGIVSTHIATALTPLVALPGAPAAADPLVPMVNFWLPEDATGASCTVTGLRFRFRTANLGIEMHGCYPTAMNIAGLNTGECPFIELTFGVSWWRYTATSGISAVAQNQYNPAPVAGGSLHVSAQAAAPMARATKAYRDMSLAITLGVAPLTGPGGVNAYQKIIGAKRIPSTVRMKWMQDADAATATPALDTLFLAGAPLTIINTLSTTDKSQIAFALVNGRVVGDRPMQAMKDGLNRIPMEVLANIGPTTTSDQTCSAFRMAGG